MAVDDIAQVNPELGASIYFAGVNLIVNSTYFEGNTGFKGGAIYLTTCPLEIKQNILITESKFNKNRGNFGGAINFSIYLKAIDAIIIYCIFSGNYAKS